MNNLNGNLKPRIINHLIQKSMTLSELDAAITVSLPTLRRALNDLIDTEWVRPVGQNAATGGRPATLFGLDAESHVIVGAHVEIPTVNMVLTQLDGQIIDNLHFAMPDNLLPDDSVRMIVDYTRQIQARFPDRKLLGIGMAAPGYVDPYSGEILYVGRAPRWQNYPMKTRLEAALRLPVIMENDTDCMIRAEIDNFDHPQARDVIYLAVLEGVKISMMLDGHLYRGAFGNTGLIGRTKLAPDYDDLEVTTSVGGVCNAFEAVLEKSGAPDDTARQIHAIEDRNQKFRAILEHSDHPLCHDIVERMVTDLTLSIANLIFVLQPNILFLGGQLSNCPNALKERLEREIRVKLPPLLSNYLIIKFAHVTGRYAAASGATQWFLHRYIAMESAFHDR